MKFYFSMFCLVFSISFLFSIDKNKGIPEHVKKQLALMLNEPDKNISIGYYLSQLNTYPDNEMILFYLALTYTKAGDFKNAEKIYINLIKQNNQNKNARAGLFSLYYNLIQNYRKNGNINQAFDYVKKGQFYLPDNSNFYLLDAELNMEISRYLEAANLFKISWEIDYKNSGSVINMWKLKKAGENFYRVGGSYINEWLDYVNDLLRKNSNEPDLMIMVADSYFFANKEVSKRNKLRNKAMDIYLKNNPKRVYPKVAFPLQGEYEIMTGFYEYNFDTHNGYDAYCLDFVAVQKGVSQKDSGERDNRVKNDNISNSGLYSSPSFGKPIFACYDGVVVASVDNNNDNPIGVTNWFTQNYIKIKHEYNGYIFYSIYYHIRKNSSNVNINQYVKKGEKIAEIGNSGYSFGPHLHFGLYDVNNVSLKFDFDDVNYSVLKKGVRLSKRINED